MLKRNLNNHLKSDYKTKCNKNHVQKDNDQDDNWKPRLH